MTSSHSNFEALAARLMAKHYAGLVRWLGHKVNDYVAEDAVSFAFGQLWLGKMPQDHPRPRAWLRVVAYNEALRMIRKPQGDVSIDALGEDYQAAAAFTDPALAADLAEKRALLAQIKPAEREALELQALGLSYDEIMAETGWSRRKVMRCIYEGRQALRKLSEGGE